MNTAAHLSTEQIADLLAGTLPAGEAMAANAHVASCAECADLRTALDDLQTLLADVAAEPMAMPDDVIDRLDSAIEAAAVERAAGVRRLEPTAPTGASRAVRWLMGAAAAVVVVSLGVVGVRALPTTSNNNANSAATNPTGSGGGTRDGVGGQDYAVGGSKSTPGLSTPGLPSNSSQGALDGVRLWTLSAGQVSAAARSLAFTPEGAIPPTRVGCASPIVGFSIASAVRYDDERAVLAIMRATRTATVFDCRTGTHAIYTTGF